MTATPKKTALTPLAPCPFCGYPALIHLIDEKDNPNNGAHYIECEGCKASTNLQWSEKGDEGLQWLIERWNRRVASREPSGLAAIVDNLDKLSQSWLDGAFVGKRMGGDYKVAAMSKEECSRQLDGLIRHFCPNRSQP